MVRSEQLDPDPMAEDHAYPFGLAQLLKSPWVFLDSTRGPIMFKNNYSLGLFLTLSPLSSLEFEPTILGCCFYELDPKVLV